MNMGKRVANSKCECLPGRIGQLLTKDESLFGAIRAAMPEERRAFLHLSDGNTISYGDMLARSGQFANALWSAGVRPGERVAVQIEKSANALLLYLACLRAGAVYLPLNPAYTLAELEYFLGDAEPACVVVSPDKESAVQPIVRNAANILTLGAGGGEGSLIDEADGQSAKFNDVARAADDLAAILYTSGTTGRSKGAMLTQNNLLCNALVLRGLWQFSEADVLLHALPIFHTHGLFTASNTLLMAGASMIFLPRFDVDAILAALPRATALMGVPTFYTRLLADARLDRAATGHVRLFICGSAPLLAGTHREWQARTGPAILERYGMTETGMIASNPYTGERVAGTVGFPLPGVDVRISDPRSGNATRAGGVGMIEVRGPNVCHGYWRKPEQTEEAFRADGFFITGDLGQFDADDHLHIVGRAKDVIITGGLNVYPKEIETEIDLLSGVHESAVIGLPHPDLGEAVTAVVVLEAGAQLDPAVAIAQLAERLANYKLPKRLLFVDKLPRNSMAKVQKILLCQIHRDIYRS